MDFRNLNNLLKLRDCAVKDNSLIENHKLQGVIPALKLQIEAEENFLEICKKYDLSGHYIAEAKEHIEKASEALNFYQN